MTKHLPGLQARPALFLEDSFRVALGQEKLRGTRILANTEFPRPD